MTYLEENTILIKSQFGFKKNLGDEDTLTYLTKELYSGIY